MASGGDSAGEPSLARSSNEFSGVIHGATVQARSIHGDVHFTLPGDASSIPVVPAQLPACSPYFTGRSAALERLDELADEATRDRRALIVVIIGQGGVGKTSLALSWAQRKKENYSDGQLFIDLRGFSGTDPVTPADALPRLLIALGIAPEKVPLSVDEQSALFRSVTVARRLVLFLDNAVSAAQVRPLLPGDGPAIIIVTTRLRLSGLVLHGAHFIDLEPLDTADSQTLLERMLGADRVRAEPDQARELVRLCGGLPLAVCTSAARLSVRRRWTIRRLVQELVDERRRLANLGAGEESPVRAVFDSSYRALPPESARLYRLLGLHPGHDFDAAAAAALADVEQEDALTALESLVDASLLTEDHDHRFRLHDLVRLHARSELGDAEQEAASHRIVRHYLAAAAKAELQMIPGRWRLGPWYEVQSSNFDQAAALGWLEEELPNLAVVQRLAFDRGYFPEVWQMCEALWGLFVYRKHYRLWLDTHEIGLRAARACGDSLGEARVLEQLGVLHLNLREFELAADLATQAIGLEREQNHAIGQATALEVLGTAELGRERPRMAAGYFERALIIHEQLGERRGVALMARRLGDALQALGDGAEAEERLTQASQIFDELDDRYNLARTLTSLGRLRESHGQVDRARADLRLALELAEQIGADAQVADIHCGLARLARGTGEVAAERDHLQAALRIYQVQDPSRAAEIVPWIRRLDPGR